jgi:hypothetical protein
METKAGGTYLYAVVPKAVAPKLGRIQGIEQGRVYTVESGDLAAVVGDIPSREELRPERRLVAAHQDVLERAAEASPAVLPVSFGTIAENPEDVRELLVRYEQDLSGQMQHVQGKVQMGVRVSYTASRPSVFEFVVANSPELRETRDRIARSGREPTRDEKIDLGQMVDAVLGNLRDEYARRVEQALGAVAECKRNPARQEREFVNEAFLVPKDRQAEFEAAVQSLGGLFPDSFTVEELGPFPPYDFVQLHVQSLGPAH